MAISSVTRASDPILEAARLLSTVEWVDQESAKQVSETAEAVVNMFTVLFYHAETGLASPNDLEEARATLQSALRITEP